MHNNRVAVVVASAGRPQAVAELLRCLNDLSELPRRFVSVPEVSDLPPEAYQGCEVIVGSRGLTTQRNAALDHLPDGIEYVFFFDDDALPRDDYIDNAVRFLDENPGVIAATGNVISDGAPLAQEIEHAAALESLSTSFKNYPSNNYGQAHRHGKLYGCNFVIRWTDVRDMRFDERLPLYSWLEDYDYARQVLTRGSIVKLSGCIAVHRGSSSGGRLAHLRFGYSQLANPVYLRTKGTFTTKIMLTEVLRPVLKNIALSLIPNDQKPWRLRRLKGNLIAMMDMLGRRLDPQRILQLRD